jgi:choline dehydrogenase-like flavoprotein
MAIPRSHHIDTENTSRVYNVYGAGHILGTYRMGNDPATSVVNSGLRTHDHGNLYLLGSGVLKVSAAIVSGGFPVADVGKSRAVPAQL